MVEVVTTKDVNDEVKNAFSDLSTSLDLLLIAEAAEGTLSDYGIDAFQVRQMRELTGQLATSFTLADAFVDLVEGDTDEAAEHIADVVANELIERGFQDLFRDIALNQGVFDDVPLARGATLSHAIDAFASLGADAAVEAIHVGADILSDILQRAYANQVWNDATQGRGNVIEHHVTELHVSGLDAIREADSLGPDFLSNSLYQNGILLIRDVYVNRSANVHLFGPILFVLPDVDRFFIEGFVEVAPDNSYGVVDVEFVRNRAPADYTVGNTVLTYDLEADLETYASALFDDEAPSTSDGYYESYQAQDFIAAHMPSIDQFVYANGGLSFVNLELNGGGSAFILGAQNGNISATGADDIIFAGESGFVSGEGGDDLIVGDWESDVGATFDGGAGDDLLYGGGGDDDLRGRNGNDLIEGGSGNDILAGGRGNDILYGNADNDILRGEQGRDTLTGNSGEDTLYGGDGRDELFGHSRDGLDDDDATDTLYGEGGNDTLVGGGGADVLEGGDGNDKLYGNDHLSEDDDNAADRLIGGSGKDQYFVGDGDTVIDSDGKGSVAFNGITLTGGEKKPDDDGETDCEDSGGSDHSSDDEEVYEGSNGETYRKSGSGLTVEYNGASLTIENWSDGDLGITLKDEGSQDGGAGDDCDDDKDPPDNFGSPLVLDLDGDGLELIALEDSVAFFDIDRDGVAERTGWAGPDDGLLAIDANLNGVIDGADELFGYGETFSGQQGQAPDADRLLGPGDLDTRYASGFAQLAEYDSNNDGFIDASDAQFSSLRIWRDLNGDGETDEGELTSLEEAGVASISLAVTTGEVENAGNLVTDFGSYTTTEGVAREISDVWFRFDQYDSRFAEPDTLDPALLDLPDVSGNGSVKSLRLAMAENPALQALVEQLNGLTAADLGKASPLIDAILYEWAAVSTPDLATGRGAYADQRSVAVMEAFADTDFAQWSGPNPRPMAGGVLADQYNTTALLFAARLIAQTDLGQTLFPELTYENNQFLVLQSGVDSATVLQRLIDSAPTDVNAALAHYQAGLRLLDTVYLSFEDVKLANDDGAGYIASVETVLQNAGIDLDYMSLVAARIGGDGDDSFLTESFNSSMYASKTPVISGGLGDDDIVLGGNRQIVYWGTGQGSDTIEIDPFSSQGWSLTPRVELRLIGVDSTDVVFERSTDPLSTDGVLRIVSTGETLTIRNLLDAESEPSGVFVFGDGETVSFAEFLDEIAALAETGTAGDDVVIQHTPGATLNGGTGDDVLMGAPGNTDYLFNSGDGSDEIRDDRSGENLLFFGPGITGGDLEFSRQGRKGTDLVITVGTSGDQITILGQFSQLAPVIGTLIFDDGSGLSYWDIEDIFMEDGPGDDTVLGTAGDDFFSGNAGSDLMRGFDGSDTYFLGAGDGVDTVDDGGDAGEDRLYLDFDFGELTISSVTGGFVFLNETTGDQVTALGIETFDFADMYDLSTNDVQTLIDVTGYDNAITGTSGADTLDGTEDNDLIVGLSGDDIINGYGGDDQIQGGDDADQLYGGDGNDTILGGAGEDLIEGGDGDDIIYAGDGSETSSGLRAGNTLRGGAGADTIDGGWEDDVLEGGAGDDILRGDFGNDDFRGGAGDDVMVDRSGASVYHYDIGDGDDLVFDDGSSSTTDAIEFGAGISAGDLTFSFVIVDPSAYTDYYVFDGPQAAIRADLAQGGSITFAGNPSDNVGSIDVLRFDDGSTLSLAAIDALARAPTAEDQLLVPLDSSSDDIMEGGGGNDTFYGNFGDLTFLFDVGDGNDTIISPEIGGNDVTTIRFGANVASSDVSISRSGEFYEDLVITLASGDSITVAGQYGLELNPYSSDPFRYGNYLDRIEFESEPGVVIDASELLLATQTATSGDDLQIGSEQADTFAASTGADELHGGRGSDTYTFGIGSGADLLVETNRGLTYIPYPDDGPELDIALLRETDTLTFGAGITVSDLILTATGSSLSDLLIEIQGTGDSLLIRDQLAASGNWGSIIDQYSDEGPHLVTAEEWEYDYADYFGEDFLFRAGVERFLFEDGTTLTWQEFADLVTNRDDEGDNTIATDDLGGMLDGGAGTDRLEGGAGDDTYVLNLGSFNDTASDTGGYDEVAFGAGISPELIAFSRVGENGDDLLIEIGGEERNSLLIEGQFAGDGRTLEYFYTDDGAEFSSQAVENLLLAQSITNGDDAILGYEGDDVIDARDGDDRIESRGGNDLIDGGEGRDTAVFRGPRSNYDVVVDGDWILVSDNVGTEGVNRIRNVETLEFLGGEGGAGAAMEVIVANQAPSAGALAFDAREDTPLILRASVLIAAAADPDGGSLSLSNVTAISGGAVEIGEEGRVVFTPDADFTGQASFTYTVVDADGAEASASVTVDVAPVNDAPELASPLADQSFDEDTVVSFTIDSGAFSDVDLDNLTLSALLSDGSDLPGWLAFDAETGSFSGTPPADFNGVLEIEITAADAEFSASGVFNLTIAPVNDAPVVATPLDDFAADAEELFEFIVPQDAFSDVDGDTLTYTATLADGSELPEWLLFSEEFGAFSGLAPTGVNGDFAIRVTATDGFETASDDFTLTITGNAAPTDISLSNASIDENSEGGAIVGVLSATDPEPGDTFTYSILTEDSPLEVDGDRLVVRDGAVIDFETQSSIDVSIEVRDSAGNPYEEQFTISVNDINEAPTDIGLSNASVDENSAAGVVVGELSAADPDTGETFEYRVRAPGDDRFAIIGSQLVVAEGAMLDFETSPVETIEIEVEDSAGNLYSEYFDIAINDVDEGSGDIVGTPGNDTLVGTAGDDVIFGLGGNDTITALGGNDVIDPGAGSDTIDGGDGYDLLDLSQTSSPVYAYLDSNYASGADYGQNFLSGIEGVIGGGGNDQFVGNAGDNTLIGNAGSDGLYGRDGADLLDGGDGSDYLHGEAGDDTILGGAGNDWVYAGTGADSIDGGAGNDTIFAQQGSDVIAGGLGDDTIYTEDGDDLITFNRGDGADIVYNSLGDDTLEFDASVAASDLTFTRINQDLLVGIAGEPDTVELKDYFNASGTASFTIVAGDGSTFSETDVAAILDGASQMSAMFSLEAIDLGFDVVASGATDADAPPAGDTAQLQPLSGLGLLASAQFDAREHLLFPQREGFAKFELSEDDPFDFSGLLAGRLGGHAAELSDVASISQFGADDPGPYRDTIDAGADLPLGQLLDDRFEASIHKPHKMFDHDAFELV